MGVVCAMIIACGCTHESAVEIIDLLLSGAAFLLSLIIVFLMTRRRIDRDRNNDESE